MHENKRTLTESIDIEKEQVRRHEARKSADETERLRQQFTLEHEDLEKRHQR